MLISNFKRELDLNYVWWDLLFDWLWLDNRICICIEVEGVLLVIKKV